MIKQLDSGHADIIFDIINRGAAAYKGAIPADCYHEPYMPGAELSREMETMTFFGWQEAGRFVGVMAIQAVKDVTLIRHAYILPDFQGRGIGSRLLAHLIQITRTKELLVGTWADATWAIDFYRKHGFRTMPDKDGLLNKYWSIPPRQVETSVVLGVRLPTPGGKT